YALDRRGAGSKRWCRQPNQPESVGNRSAESKPHAEAPCARDRTGCPGATNKGTRSFDEGTGSAVLHQRRVGPAGLSFRQGPGEARSGCTASAGVSVAGGGAVRPFFSACPSCRGTCG